jgi:hypothetical protein
MLIGLDNLMFSDRVVKFSANGAPSKKTGAGIASGARILGEEIN